MAAMKVEAVDVFRTYLDEMLAAAGAKPRIDAIEPPIQKAHIASILEQLGQSNTFPSIEDGAKKSMQYAIIETAVRDAFVALLATCTIDAPEFVQIWNLLDIVNILGDDEQCDPALLFWLVEELIDSQTISGCRKIFDYLESRRERMIGKNFESKKLVILRTCNELLRRLSRAEDTAFCGRVFIYMFQSFPLGDKSSVNLRGEYHVENVTTYCQTLKVTEDAADKMDVDAAPTADSQATNGSDKNGTKSVSFSKDKASIDADGLYPTFWSLQHYFSQPKGLFERTKFDEFKKGLQETMAFFQPYEAKVALKGPPKPVDESKKRKRTEDDDDDFAHTFNPKYLTSRDLFELEIKDLVFRRNILVQALIIMDFLLSLSAKSREKLQSMEKPNQSVMYKEHTLSPADEEWVLATKKSIGEYLKRDHDGPFFHRMVDSVLSRDKNWVAWKIESCPPIELSAIQPDAYLESKKTMKKNTAKKRLRPTPMGSLDLTFLSEADPVTNMERLKIPARYELPSLISFKRKIEEDELEIDMPTTDESKQEAILGKASKSWRALRIASKTRLVVFDKIEDSEKIGVIFEDKPMVEKRKRKSEGSETEKSGDDGGKMVDEEEKEEGAQEAEGGDKMDTDKIPETEAAAAAEEINQVTAEEGKAAVDEMVVEGVNVGVVKDNTQLTEASIRVAEDEAEKIEEAVEAVEVEEGETKDVNKAYYTGKNVLAIDKQVSSFRAWNAPKSTKSVHWIDQVRSNTGEAHAIKTEVTIEFSWAYQCLRLRELATKVKNALTLDTRRNGWYFGRDDRIMLVDGRRVNEAMCDHADYIMDSCAMWKTDHGNKKSAKRAGDLNRRLGAEQQREGQHQVMDGRKNIYKLASGKGYKLN